MFYIEENNKIVLFDEDKQKLQDTLTLMPQYKDLEIKEVQEGYTIVDFELMTVEQAEEKAEQKEREQLDRLTLTPADVERALYKAKSMDFEDLKALIAEKIPTIDLKALAIEFRAKDFYRGATIRSLEAEQLSSSDDENFQAAELPSRQSAIRLFDVVGQLLGYTPDDMDYLFKNKELPNNENTTDN